MSLLRIVIALPLAALLAAPVTTSTGDLRVTEGVRLSAIQFDVRGTRSVPAGRRITVPVAGTLPATAGAERVRMRADGGVFPSPFVSISLPWPPA